MRLFTGLDLPDDVLQRVEAAIARLKPMAPVNWSPVRNLHITTKFIGEWPEAKLESLQQALARTPRPGVFEIAVRGFGWFPNPHHPRNFWAGIHAPAALAELARATNEELAKIGIAAEEKKFSPHLTLARIKTHEHVPVLRQAVAKTEAADFGAFEARSFFLYLSEPKAGGSVYTKLSEFPLAQ